MKKLILILSISTALFGCKERTNLINFKDVDQLYIDSSYTAAPKAPQSKGVLIEDLTGVRCANCPNAQTSARNTVAKYPAGKVILVSMHPDDMGSLVIPYPNNKYDFRSPQVSHLLENYLGGKPNSLPLGMVDRGYFGGATPQLSYFTWDAKVAEQATKTTPVNIDSNKIVYDSIKDELKASFLISFTEDVADEAFVTVGLMEDSMVETQEKIGSVDSYYVHLDVLRKYMEPYDGLSLGKSNTKGRFYRVTFTTSLKASKDPWKQGPDYIAKNCHLVVLVHKRQTGDYGVYHTREFEIK